MLSVTIETARRFERLSPDKTEIESDFNVLLVIAITRF